jgi:hypothetical protein
VSGPIDFAKINRVALAAFPAVLARILPSGKHVGSEYLAINPSRADRHAGSFKVNIATVAGRISRPATRAAIRFRLSHTSAAFRRAKRRECWRACSA